MQVTQESRMESILCFVLLY